MPPTPGPWRLDIFTDGALPQGRIFMGDVKLATCWTAYDNDMDLRGWSQLPSVDNARLMSAAPDLLAACKYALARFTHGPDAITNPNDAIVDDLRAAIAKAGGKDS